MTTYFEAPDGHGESCIWIPTDNGPWCLLRQSDVAGTDRWPDVVARMTGTPITTDDATVRTTGADLIAAERKRQIEVEGYTTEHDAHFHSSHDLTDAAMAYTMRSLNYWPWESTYFKLTPGDRQRELVKAGALIAAAIDALAALTGGAT